MKVDFGKLTAEETKDIAREALTLLSEDDLMEVLNSALNIDQKAELAANWEEGGD